MWTFFFWSINRFLQRVLPGITSPIPWQALYNIVLKTKIIDSTPPPPVITSSHIQPGEYITSNEKKNRITGPLLGPHWRAIPKGIELCMVSFVCATHGAAGSCSMAFKPSCVRHRTGSPLQPSPPAQVKIVRVENVLIKVTATASALLLHSSPLGPLESSLMPSSAGSHGVAFKPSCVHHRTGSPLQHAPPVLWVIGEESEIKVGYVTFFADLSVITLQKCRNFRFLTSILQKEGVNYHWGFPFKLIIKLKSRKVIIRTIPEAEVFLGKLQNGELDSPPVRRRQEGHDRQSAGKTISVSNSKACLIILFSNYTISLVRFAKTVILVSWFRWLFWF